jgi:hypothetical protein
MNILGIDFTSAPSSRKPITVAHCDYSPKNLRLTRLDTLPDFGAFEALLRSNGPWVAAIDFPFGQPLKLVKDLGWPTDWSGYVSKVADMSKDQFVNRLRQYKSRQPKGHKHLFRPVDRAADSCSPMMTEYTPVGRMFFEGAQRLLQSPCCIRPCRPNQDPRTVLEAYPGILVKELFGEKLKYKADNKKKLTSEHRKNRARIIAALESQAPSRYGLAVGLSSSQRTAMVNDGTGDTLDALLCAVQAAWAYTIKDQGWGIPDHASPSEGWIPDPALYQT